MEIVKNKILLVVNPVAGNGNIKKDIGRIIKNFQNSGFEVQTEYTTVENDAEWIVENKADNDEIVIAVGRRWYFE